MLRFLAVFAACSLLFLVSGCESTELNPVSREAFSQNAGHDSNGVAWKLAVGDTIELSVEVDGRMEVSGHRSEINSSGRVTLPLVGDVKIDGKTLGEARMAIEQTYGAYYVNPPVIMLGMVKNPADAGEWGYITVTGRVQQPGRVKVDSAKGMKLTAVIQQAGGFSPSAKTSEVRVTRMEKNGRRIQTVVDYSEIGEKGNVEADLDLLDGDIVYVPERMF